jgi:hypothetical protein
VSLVREALAKAEREAAARAAREKGLPPALADAAQPYRAPRRPRWPWAAALAAATLVGAGAAYLLLDARAEKGLVSSRDSMASSESDSATPSTDEKLSLKGETGSAPATESADVSERQTPSGTEPPAQPPQIAAPAETAQAIAPAEPSPGAERPNPDRIPNKETAPRTEAPSRPQEPFPTGGRGTVADADPGAGSPPAPAANTSGALAGSYVKEFALDGGRSIRLGGIAWSEAAPLAYLNGKLRGVGEIVEGWRVAAIERERVLLESGRLKVALRLR